MNSVISPALQKFRTHVASWMFFQRCWML